MQQEVIGYQIADYYLDLKRKTLSKGGETFELGERNFRLLQLLAEASPDPISKLSLSSLLWTGTVVSDWSLFRLISDTRQVLGDDGDQQTLIRTARGIGFYLTTAQPVYASPENLNEQHASSNVETQQAEAEVSQKASKRRLWPGVAVVIMMVVAWILFPLYQQHQLLEAAKRISALQDSTFTMFLAQVARRNELRDMIEIRTGTSRQQSYEQFFASHYQQLTQSERFVFDQIRSMTEKGLYQYNQAILNELEANPALYDEIEQTFELQQHLQFWLKKYHNVFLTRKDMCLLYVGVEDGVPYPSGVDQTVKAWIASQTDAAQMGN